METELVIQGVSFPPFSARGCIQTLTPLEGGDLKRTINGELIYSGSPRHQKYHSVITCQDKTAVSLEGLWRGSVVDVHCIQRFWQLGEAEEITLSKDPVEGSIMVHGGDLLETRGRSLKINGGKGVYVSYRPKLTMSVLKFSLLTDEWGMACGWSLDLEEI